MATVNVIHGATVDSFNYLVYPDQNPANQQYIQNQLGQFSSTVNDIGRGFLEASRELYERINDTNAIKAAKAALRSAKGFFHPNIIKPLYNLDEIRTAQPMMQRYIMAQPDIRDLYHRQMCDGYSDSYVDIEPLWTRYDHYDYRRVMTGIIVETDDTWSATTYAHDSLGDDVDLTMEEQVNILSTWDIVAMFVAANIDCTDIEGGDL